MSSPRWQSWLLPVLLFTAGVIVSLIYWKPPTLGDDIEYWGLAMDLHQGVPGAWKADSFHDLRWPVWGVCWLLQIFFGFGSWSYFLQPAVYLGLGAIVIYYLAAKVGVDLMWRYVAVLLFLFHPLLDPSMARPMPDLSEGFWVALSFFLWLHLMEAEDRRKMVVLCALIGLSLTAAQANRITGVFAIPVLFLGTVLLYPRRFGWLILAGIFAGVFVFIEAAIYATLTGDWLHSLHANLGARGRKGTESIPLWLYPFRFLPLLWRTPQDIIFSIVACVGWLAAFLGFGKAGRAVALYALVYYLTYNCAVQSLSPLRPLVRDGERFMASLAFPFSVLCACGLQFIGSHLSQYAQFERITSLLRRRTGIALGALTAVLFLISGRSQGEENYLPQIRAYLQQTADGTRIYSHNIFRYVASMADPGKTAKLQWELDSHILAPSPETLAKLDSFDEIWLIRKHAWVRNRKRSETGAAERLESLAPYLTPPLSGWKVTETVMKGDVPDFLFLRRTSDPAIDSAARNFLAGMLPSSFNWENYSKGKVLEKRWTDIEVPKELRGREVFLWFHYSSDRTEPIRLRVEFFTSNGNEPLESLLFKPYLFPQTSPDFFALQIPDQAEKMTLILRVDAKVSWLNLEGWDAIVY